MCSKQPTPSVATNKDQETERQRTYNDTPPLTPTPLDPNPEAHPFPRPSRPELKRTSMFPQKTPSRESESFISLYVPGRCKGSQLRTIDCHSHIRHAPSCRLVSEYLTIFQGFKSKQTNVKSRKARSQMLQKEA